MSIPAATRRFISKRTTNALTEILASRDLRRIEDAFDAGDIPRPQGEPLPDFGKRRALVERYLRQLDLARWEDASRLQRVIEVVLDELGEQPVSEAGWERDGRLKALETLSGRLMEDGFRPQGNGFVYDQLTSEAGGLAAVATRIDARVIEEQSSRIRDSILTDPSLAVGTAKELLESTCKTILTDRAVPWDKKWDFNQLVKAVRMELKLMPDDIPESAKGRDAIKQILSSLGTLSAAINTLRGLYGTGHGPHGRVKGLQPRHARLAASAAIALATFLLETHEASDPS